MAKYTNTELMLDGPPVYDGKLKLVSHTKGKVVFEDSDSGDTIIYTGHGLAVKKGIIVDGHLTGWTYANGDEQAYTVIKGFNINLDTIHASTTLAFSNKVYNKMLGGNDTMTGSSAADTLVGLGGNDKINGNEGADSLYGGSGNDTINAGIGNDWIVGGKGNDKLTGGGGNDSFSFAKGDGKDTITDFNADEFNVAEHDYIIGKYEDVIVTATGKDDQDTLINFGGGTTVILKGVMASEISTFDFYLP